MHFVPKKYKSTVESLDGMPTICGIDEAGRGPVIGPMVMAGVLIDEEQSAQLKKLGVKDSKLLSPELRNQLFEKIIAIVRDYEVRIVSAEEIDSALNSPSLNLNWLEATKSAEIINRLMPDKAIVDCPSTNTEAYKAYLKNKLIKKETKLIAEHKADVKYPVVSAASIIAKVTRDREIEKLRQTFGDFGSGYPSDEKTARFLKDNHHLPIFRKTWQPWKDAAAQKKQKKLGEF
jgi:ribonuclease HII